MPFLSCASSRSRVSRHRLRKGSKRVLIKSRAVSLPPQWNGLQVDAERAGWKVDVQATCLLRVPNSVLHTLIRSHVSVRAASIPPFLVQHGIEVLVRPLALQPHALAKMPFAAQTETLK